MNMRWLGLLSAFVKLIYGLLTNKLDNIIEIIPSNTLNMEPHAMQPTIGRKHAMTHLHLRQ